MWTAAFPEYGSKLMVPYLAASGQFPHTPLGIQFENSSLAHPRSPGVNDVHLRPLWKLWGLFKNERRVSIFNEYNSENVFLGKSQDTGAYLMISEDAQRALLILSNFNDAVSTTRVEVDWARTGFNAAECRKRVFLRPDTDSPGEPLEQDARSKSFSAEVEAFGVAAWALSLDANELDERLRLFRMPYVQTDKECEQHLARIEKQRKFRKEPPVENAVFLKVELANLAAPYEESLWWDLFDNAFQLGVFDASGEFTVAGWISTKGFVADEPPKEEYILPGHHSPWIDLRETLPSGRNKVGVRSIHFGEPFYSFIKITLSTKPDDDSESYNIEFFNEIENDRSFLRFNIVL
jgi:hypothetical protein